MEYEHKEFRTEIYHDYAGAAQELLGEIKSLKGKVVYFRVEPEVLSERRFDYKDEIFMGYMRYVVLPIPVKDETGIIS